MNTPRPGPAAWLESWLRRLWWQPRPSPAARYLEPLATLYGALATQRRHTIHALRLPVPVLVVGNLIVGGAGKTPTVIALVQALLARGHRPGIVSRGWGRRSDALVGVRPGMAAREVGDEPLLMHLRTGAPVWVGRDRVSAGRALCVAHPEVDVIVSDDGLQHHRLARDVELLVFDERGIGNGLLLPAGPLREPLPAALAPRQRVLYTGSRATTPLPGALATRRLEQAVLLQDWRSGQPGQPLAALLGRRLVAAAGLAAPEKFFAGLRAAGLSIDPLPLPDHHDYPALPWPSATADVITTEKDAVKIDPARVGSTRVWVAPLDLLLPAALTDELSGMLFAPAASVTAPVTAP